MILLSTFDEFQILAFIEVPKGHSSVWPSCHLGLFLLSGFMFLRLCKAPPEQWTQISLLDPTQRSNSGILPAFLPAPSSPGLWSSEEQYLSWRKFYLTRNATPTPNFLLVLIIYFLCKNRIGLYLFMLT